MSALRTTSNGQQLADHWDLDHPFERLLVDTAVAPDACAVDWINSRLRPGERWRVVTGIPGKTGVVYTLDRATGKFLWATPTIAQNIISHIDGAPGTVLEKSEVVFSATGQEELAPGVEELGTMLPISAETGETLWRQAGRHHVARGHRGRTGIRRRCERPVPGT